jgi:DNA-binding beta-propeller fold protein YncE
MKRIFLGAAVMAVLLLSACAGLASTPLPQVPEADSPSEATSETDQSESEGELMQSVTQEQSFAGSVEAPEFPQDLDWLNTDRPLTLEQLEGKLVLLDFWTYGCINCIHIIPDLKRLEAEYPNELVVIGVHSAKFENEGETENIRQIILRYDLEHPVVNDRDFQVWGMWGARAWPTVVLIDPAGKIVGGHSGEGIYSVFKPVIEVLVQEFDQRGELDRTPLEVKLEKEGLPSTMLRFPGKILVDAPRGRMFIADTKHHRVIVADVQQGDVLQVIGRGEPGFEDGNFAQAAFKDPQGMALSPDGSVLYVADTENHALRRVLLEEQQVETLAGTGQQAKTYPPTGGQAPDVDLTSPWDVALDGDQLYIAMAGSHQLWRMNLSDGSIGPMVGSGREGTRDAGLSTSTLAQPSGLALDGSGRLYFADSEASTIRWAEVDADAGQVTTLVGSGESLFDFGDVDGVGSQAKLQHPLGVVFHDGSLYVADTYNHKIKVVDPDTAQITTLAGGEAGWRDGPDPLFYEPGGLDFADGKLYIADTNNHAVRVVDVDTGATYTLVLKGIESFTVPTASASNGVKMIRLDAQQVRPGEGSIRLNVRMPEGFKFNDLAPSSVAWLVQGNATRLPEDAGGTLSETELPMSLPVVFQEGEAQLTVELNIYYCEQERESLCLIEMVQLEVPIEVGSGETTEVTLMHEIVAPEEFYSQD